VLCGPQRLAGQVGQHPADAAAAGLRVVIAARERLRALGIRLAVDDAGAGYASLRHILAALVAEGVETQAELDTLRVLGVDHDQGYFIARPSISAHHGANWRAPAPAPRERQASDRAVYIIPPVA
jgi:EAL domain-containing protein (putative c-di-GMP-specific phosphodiesterase class I)